jgi:hypothetical protein
MVRNHVIKFVYTHNYYKLLHINISNEGILECVSFLMPCSTNAILLDRVDWFNSNAMGMHSGHDHSNLRWNTGIPCQESNPAFPEYKSRGL